MEKLLNLLNEYECYRNGYDICTGWQERDGRIVWVADDPRPQVRSEYYILSKEFGFIKWLVDNDKIELEAGPLYGCQLIMHNRQPYTLYETILMLLAIEENPIDLLCSILK